LLLEDLALYAHGRIGGELTVFAAVSELVALAVMIGVPLLLLRARHTGLPAIITPDRSPEQRLLLVFCGAVILGTAGAFIVSSSPLDIFSARYTLAMWPMLLIAWAILSPPRATITGLAILATIAAVLGCNDLGRGTYTTPTSPFPTGRPVGDLARFVAAEHLDHGYAGYWEAATITAQTDFKVRLYPVQDCGDGRCPPAVHRIDAWYKPKLGRIRTLYVVDRERIGVGTAVSGPPPRWGPPAKAATFGKLDVFVYNYDLATKLRAGT
jgi:hypothetical protein